MVYAYLRVSTDKQQIENQRHEIKTFAAMHNFQIDMWVEEHISGVLEKEIRSLGKILKMLETGDTLIVSEISRLSRKMLEIMDIMRRCLLEEINVYCIKENFILKNDLQSKILLFAFGLSAEVEKNFISQRTKEALALRKAKGMILGRPRGSNVKYQKLVKHKNEIDGMLKKNHTKLAIARHFEVSPPTLYRFLKNFELLD